MSGINHIKRANTTTVSDVTFYQLPPDSQSTTTFFRPQSSLGTARHGNTIALQPIHDINAAMATTSWPGSYKWWYGLLTMANYSLDGITVFLSVKHRVYFPNTLSRIFFGVGEQELFDYQWAQYSVTDL